MEARLSALQDLGQRLILLRDPHRIAEAVLEIAARVLALQDSDFLLVDDTRNELYVTARQGELCRAEGLRLPLDGGKGITVAAARRGQPIYARDVRQDSRYVDIGFPAVSEFAVPVQIEGRVLGVLNVESTEFDAFGEADRKLLCILANQAALALENARLHAQEQRKIEELAILNELNRRISASLDLQETLDAVVASASVLIPCALAEVSLWDPQTGMLTLQAIRSEPDRDYPVGSSFPPGEGYTGWIVKEKKPLLVPDVECFDEFQPHLLPGERPFKAYAGVPLLAGNNLVGTLILVSNEAEAFDQDVIRLLQSLANQASIAIHNAQLFQDTQRKANQLAVLNDIADLINRPIELQEILDLAVEKVLEVMETDFAVIRLFDKETGALYVASFCGPFPNAVAPTDRVQFTEEIARRIDDFHDTLVYQIPADAPGLDYLGNSTKEIKTLAVTPVRVANKTVGILGVSTHQPREFTSEDLDLLSAMGHQVGVAMENAQLRQESLAAERLAAVGRVAASVAHDMRSPLGGVLRSAEFLARPELSPATRQKVSQAIISLARRLINNSQQILDFVQRERLPLKCAPCSITKFLDELLLVLEVDFSDRGIEVVREYHFRGIVVMDSDRMAQVVYNIAANARDAMPQGGKFSMSTRKVKDCVEMRFSDTGPGVPEKFGERIFEPFFSYGKRQGAGLGLAIARRIVEEHGGTILMEGKEVGGAEFVVILPL